MYIYNVENLVSKQSSKKKTVEKPCKLAHEGI
jgi:hypothetical protein